MTWFVGLILATVLVVSEWNASVEITNPTTNLVSVLIAVALPIGLAEYQRRRILGRSKHRGSKVQTLQWISATNAAVWAGCSLAIATVLGWPVLVRATWALDRFLVLDEIVILLPMILSITASWLLLVAAETTLLIDCKSTKVGATPKRIFVNRIRILAGLILVPMLMLFLIRDLTNMLVPDDMEWWRGIAYSTGLVLLMVIFPKIICRSWDTSDLEDGELRDRLQKCARELGVQVGIRAWDTQRQTLNAVVVGLVPRTRMVLFSDLLLSELEDDEVESIFRHELGHVLCRHLLSRMLLLVVPILLAGCLLVHPFWGPAVWHFVKQMGVPVWAFAGFLLPATYVCYILLVVVPLARMAELEADLVACTDANRKLCSDRLASYQSALRKMALWSPELYHRDSLLHPSIKSRLLWSLAISEQPELITRFQGKFRHQQSLAMAAIASGALPIAFALFLA